MVLLEEQGDGIAGDKGQGKEKTRENVPGIHFIF